MMTGYSLVQKIRKLEEACYNLGIMICKPKHSSYDHADSLAIKPKDQDSLPIYSRDAELFIGTVDELAVWIRGVEWARNYDTMIFGKNHEIKRQQKEQIERNRQLISIIKT